MSRGQLITSSIKISDGTGVPRGTVERIIKYLKNEELIEEQTTTKFRLITVKNYKIYQPDEEQNEERMRNKRGTDEEQMDTYKNVRIKELKNEKKGGGTFVPPSTQEILDYCLERKNGIDPNKFLDFYASKGWMIGKNKMKDWKAAIRTWEKRDQFTNNGISNNTEEQLKKLLNS